MNWYYSSDGSELGPVNANQLRELANVGEIGPDDLVRSDEMEQSVHARRIKGLFPKPSTVESRVMATDTTEQNRTSSSSASVVNHARGAVKSISNAAKLKALQLQELPKADLKIGARAFQLGLLLEELRPQHEAIRRIDKEIAQKQESSPIDENTTLIDRTKSLASIAKGRISIERLLRQRKRTLTEAGRRIRESHSLEDTESIATEIQSARKVVSQIEELQQPTRGQRDTILPSRKMAAILGAVVAGIALIGLITFVAVGAKQRLAAIWPSSSSSVGQEDDNRQQEMEHDQEQYQRGIEQDQLQEQARREQEEEQRRELQERLQQERQESSSAIAEREEQYRNAQEARRQEQLAIAQEQEIEESEEKARRMTLLAPCLSRPEDYLVVTRTADKRPDLEGRYGEGSTEIIAIDSLETILSDVQFRENSRPVHGISDRLFYYDIDWLQESPYGIVSGSPSLFNPVDSDETTYADHSLDDIYLSLDFRRVFFFRSGDLWRAQYNWETKQIENERRLTDVGLFDQCRILLFSGNNLYLTNPFNESLPVIHIDLQDGSCSEREYITDIPGDPVYSPNGRFAIVALGRWLHIRDMQRNESVNIDCISPSRHSMNEELGASLLYRPQFTWVDEFTAVTEAINGRLAVLDLRKAEIRMLNLDRGPHAHFEYDDDNGYDEPIELVLPHSRLVQFVRGGAEGTERFIVDVDSGVMEKLPSFIGDIYDGSHWIDSTHCLYRVESGGLRELGLWVYDRVSRKSTRLSPRPASSFLLAVPEKGMIFFKSDQEHYFRAEMNGENIQEIPEWGNDIISIERIFPAPVSLGLGGRAQDPWALNEPSRILPRVLASEENIPRTEDWILRQALKDEPADIQETARGCPVEC